MAYLVKDGNEMVFGDPHKFAILAAPVDKWTDPESYVNGIFHFIIDGNFLPEKTRVATLSGDAFCFDDNHPLISFPENEVLFNEPPAIAFKNIMELILPQELDPHGNYPPPDERYKASTYNLEDGGSYVFVVCWGDRVRVLGAQVSRQKPDAEGVLQWEEVIPTTIHEVYLSKDEALNIASGFISNFGKINT
ncbi:Imm42 family immunity protein [Xanthomonas sp. NCPPB 3582]|uniref:Imm42 family immunity protein n=1 Tax=Xanthomonas sp. NCPPB 3582 TaxID=487557 RepID=UPI003556D104